MPKVAEFSSDTGEADRMSARERRRVLLWCAPLTMLFTLADMMAVHGFSWPAFLVRLTWAASIVAVALALPKVTTRIAEWLFVGLASLSAIAFVLLVQFTGGVASPLFHWILASPLTIAVVIQDHPEATASAGVLTVLGGLAVLAAEKTSSALCIQWAVQAAGMSSLAVYASAVYRRLRRRERASRDASLLARAETRLFAEAVQARDDFLAVAAHELRTPLTSLKLQVDGLVRPGPSRSDDQGSAGKRLAVVDRQVQRLAALVERLLDVSRLRSGAFDLELESVDLALVVATVLERLSPQLSSAGCQVNLRGELSSLGHWDRLRLEQVVSNLVANASKYGAGAPIEIELGGDDAQAQLHVRDRGIGISPADQERIFLRFERAASPRQYGGLGLGLWIAGQLVGAMGGRITVVSTPGQGAQFTVTLPRNPDGDRGVSRSRLRSGAERAPDRTGEDPA
jgi:signal transduction histidine kinase